MSEVRLIEDKVWLVLKRVGDYLAEQNIESYVVGGLLRDRLLKRATADIDIALAADALEVAPKVALVLGGRFILLDKVNRVSRVVLAEKETTWKLDFSTIEGSLEQDLARRDFTIDAMAIPLKEALAHYPSEPPALLDPFHGWEDLQQGVIRAVAETVFASDPARLLRAVRLAEELGFTIEKETEALIQRYSHLIASVSGERVREELLRLLACSRVGKFLAYLDRLTLLTAVFPELARTKGVEQPKEHCWNVFEHSIKTVSAIEFLFRQDDWEYADAGVLAAVPWSEALSQHFDREVSSGSTRRSLLKLAALLHDIAKPQTKAIDAEGRLHFFGHAKEGAAIAATMLERLRFSVREIKLVETIVNHHLRPGQMSQDELPTRRAIYRYFRDTAEAGIDILFLSLADHLATRGQNLDLSHWQEHTRMVEYVLAEHLQEQGITHSPKLVDGHDLIKLFGMSPGAEIGGILEQVGEAQASGEITTREEALSLIKKIRQAKEYA